MMKILYGLLVIITISSCKNKPTESTEKQPLNNVKQAEEVASKPSKTAQGVNVFDSINNLYAAYTNLKEIFDKNTSIKIVAELDHAKNAEKAGMNLPPTSAIFFGNPNLGTPLMQANPLAGLDLPQKIVYLQDQNGKNQIIYNDVEYLNQRYGLDNHKNLSVISNTLKTLVEKTSGSQDHQTTNFEVSKHQGMVTKASQYDYASTLDRLMTILDKHKALKVIAQLDHQANAKSAGLDLKPTYLIVFGNPKMGSPLMKSQQSLALDLPQKMLVWEDKSGQTFVSYNDIYFLKERHHIQGHDEIFKKISTALDKISSKAVE